MEGINITVPEALHEFVKARVVEGGWLVHSRQLGRNEESGGRIMHLSSGRHGQSPK
jgi:hypothetical protein